MPRALHTCWRPPPRPHGTLWRAGSAWAAASPPLGRLQLDLGWPRLLLLAGAHAADRRDARCCCSWRPPAPACWPAALVGHLGATVEHLWARVGALTRRSGAHGAGRRRAGRSPRGAHRSPAIARTAVTTHETHICVRRSDDEVFMAARRKCDAEYIARRRLRRAVGALSVGSEPMRAPRSGRARAEGHMATRWRGEGNAAPLGDLAIEEQRGVGDRGARCACPEAPQAAAVSSRGPAR